MTSIFVSMLVFALIGAISPGPVNIIAASAGAHYGFKKALPHVVGATFSYTLMVYLMGIGLDRTMAFFPQFTELLKYLGGAFLLYMSYKIATATPFDVRDIQQKTVAPSLLEGMLSQGLNPKAWLVSMSGVSLFVLHKQPVDLYIWVFCSISFVACFFGVGTWAAIGQLIGRFLSTGKRQLAFNVIMGLLLASTVVSIFLG